MRRTLRSEGGRKEKLQIWGFTDMFTLECGNGFKDVHIGQHIHYSLYIYVDYHMSIIHQ